MSEHITYINFFPQIFLLGNGLAQLLYIITPKEQRKGVNT